MSGCAHVTETAKVIWGSSIRALEDARVDALTKTYRCSLNDCYDAVLDLSRHQNVQNSQAENETEIKSTNENYFDVFIDNRKKGHMVIMGIEGNVDTTEVGIFFFQPTLTTVKIEISSLSSSAKRKAAQIIFDALNLRFSESQ
ncbi:MAG: hypothetical protein JW847_03335 [Candidatus Omnitrophica bacterium]|nr:hypothetical protein [Candidatus Omnitrophota bacterium]